MVWRDLFFFPSTRTILDVKNCNVNYYYLKKKINNKKKSKSSSWLSMNSMIT